ncbi:MAG: FG-GAP repeat protein, partial [Bacteroidota bacterium]
WNLLQKIVPSDRSSSDNFGTAVAVDGDVAVISAIQDANGLPGQPTLGLAGSAYVFTQNQNGSWGQTVKLVPSDRESVDQFGKSVAVSGNTIMVGAWQEDQDENNANFITDAGSVYVFERDSAGNWTQVQKLTASDRSFNDRFGNAVALDGNYAVIAAIAQDLNAAGGQPVTDAGAAYIFERDTLTGLWSEVQKLTPHRTQPR